MKCVLCGGPLKNESVVFSYEDDNTHMFVEHVPAQVCQQCGERTYSPEVTEELVELSKNQVKPTRIISVPVYDYNMRHSQRNL